MTNRAHSRYVSKDRESRANGFNIEHAERRHDIRTNCNRKSSSASSQASIAWRLPARMIGNRTESDRNFPHSSPQARLPPSVLPVIKNISGSADVLKIAARQLMSEESRYSRPCTECGEPSSFGGKLRHKTGNHHAKPAAEEHADLKSRRCRPSPDASDRAQRSSPFDIGIGRRK